MARSNTPGFSLLPIIAILAGVTLAGFIGWRVYDINIKNSANQSTNGVQNTNQSANNNQSTSNQQSTTNKTYKSEAYGYSLEYPKDWTATSAMQQSTEVITLTAPGTVTTEQPIGGYTTDKGAIITLDVSKCVDSQTCAIPDAYEVQFPSPARNRSKFMLNSGVQADRYTFGWEAEQALYTLFALNNTLFMPNLTVEGDELTSPYLQDYNNIINSIKF